MISMTTQCYQGPLVPLLSDQQGMPKETIIFLSLTTGQVLNRVHATPLPMPDDVID